jgi:hypothetical protein
VPEGGQGLPLSPLADGVTGREERLRRGQLLRCGRGVRARSGLRQLAPPNDCVADSTDQAQSICGTKVDSLQGAYDVQLSRDGRFAYVGAEVDDAVTVFSRDPTTGALARASCVAWIRAPRTSPSCRHTARGLNGAEHPMLSPDAGQSSVYVNAFYGNSLATFSRNPSTGAITQLRGRRACVEDAGPSTPRSTDCPVRVIGMEGTRPAALSPDGRNLYVPGSVGESIAQFAVRP